MSRTKQDADSQTTCNASVKKKHTQIYIIIMVPKERPLFIFCCSPIFFSSCF